MQDILPFFLSATCENSCRTGQGQQPSEKDYQEHTYIIKHIEFITAERTSWDKAHPYYRG